MTLRTPRTSTPTPATCGADNAVDARCRVEAIIGIDQRGQFVLPKDLRERAGMAAGDKLAVTSWEKDGRICCITLTKVDGLADIVKKTVGPVMKEIL